MIFVIEEKDKEFENEPISVALFFGCVTRIVTIWAIDNYVWYIINSNLSPILI